MLQSCTMQHLAASAVVHVALEWLSVCPFQSSILFILVLHCSTWCPKSLLYSQEEIVPKNILMIGPTGCGKTEIARRLAKLADAPFVKVCPTCMQAHVQLPDVLCLL